MAEVVKSIKSSGGDYATLASWEAAIPSNQAVGDPWVARFDEAMDGGPVTINVSNANSAPHRITVASGYRFNEDASWPSCAGVEGAAARIVNTASLEAVVVSIPAVVVEFLELDGGGLTNGVVVRSNSGGSVTVRHLIVHDTRYGIAATGGDLTAHHVMLWDDSQAGFYINQAASTLTIYASTAFSCSRGVQRANGTLNAYNVACVGNTTDFSGTIGGSNNLSEDTSAPGTSPTTSVAASTILENVTGGSEDLHLKSSVDGTYEGGDLSGTIGSLDIDGDTRSDWDIGADEIAAVGGVTVPLLDGRMLTGGFQTMSGGL